MECCLRVGDEGCKATVGGTNMRHHVARDVVLMAGSVVNS